MLLLFYRSNQLASFLINYYDVLLLFFPKCSVQGKKVGFPKIYETKVLCPLRLIWISVHYKIYGILNRSLLFGILTSRCLG